MTPRWLACVVVGLAAQAVYGQTSPVAAPEFEDAQTYEDAEDWNSGPIAPTPPPALPDERPPARPFAGAVWTSGHWFWDGDQWRLKPGAWVAPMPGYQFINGFWEQDGNVWRWVASGWARPGSVEVEIPIDAVSEELSTAQAPPPLRTELRPAQPSPELTWAPGYWYWSGTQWAWIEGSWVEAPQPGLVFVAPKWIRRGPSWRFVGGGWAVRGSTRISVPVYRHARIAVSWGHPSYFLYSWHRYPVVHRYYGDRGYYGDKGRYDNWRRYRDRGHYRDRSHHRDRDHDRGWGRDRDRDRGHPGGRDHDRGPRGGGYRNGPGRNTHGATPAGPNWGR